MGKGLNNHNRIAELRLLQDLIRLHQDEIDAELESAMVFLQKGNAPANKIAGRVVGRVVDLLHSQSERFSLIASDLQGMSTKLSDD